jgi:hypothetical protein
MSCLNENSLKFCYSVTKNARKHNTNFKLFPTSQCTFVRRLVKAVFRPSFLFINIGNNYGGFLYACAIIYFVSFQVYYQPVNVYLVSHK